MPFESIDQARVLQFKANVTHLFQEKGGSLRGKTREESLVGKAHFFERLQKEAAVPKTTRHGDTVVLDPIHSRRMVVPKDYVWAALVDQQDKIRLLIDPASEYAIACAYALGRAFDDEIIKAFAGNAMGGEDGSVTVTFASEAAADLSFVSAALTTPNILTIKKAMDVKSVPMENRYLLYHPAAVEQLLKASTAPLASSSDYNTVKALVRGELDTWCGFKWIPYVRTIQELPEAYAGGDATRPYCFAWHHDAMGIAIGKDITARLTERPDKDYAVQTYGCLTMGATRIQGEGVARFVIDTDN